MKILEKRGNKNFSEKKIIIKSDIYPTPLSYYQKKKHSHESQCSLSCSTWLYFFRQMLNVVLQKQKVAFAKYAAGKKQEIKPFNSFQDNKLSRTVKQ